MRPSLQNKFNVLGFLLIAFFLLMLPMFSQVKADTRQSMDQAKDTAMYKWTHSLQTKFKPPKDLSNTEVEDYWAQQAREADPACGDACNPDADKDGDGMSNADELKAGRNPSCNEEKYGAQYCQNADKYNLTTPENVTKRLPVVQLANITLQYSPDCTQSLLGTCPPRPFDVNETFKQVVAYLNVTGYSGSGWSATLVNSGNRGPQWSTSPSGGPAATSTDYRRPYAKGTFEPADSGTYRFTVQANSGGNSPVVGSGTWNLQVWGLR